MRLGFAVLAGLLAFASLDQRGSAQQSAPALRLYVLDCGTLIYNNPESGAVVILAGTFLSVMTADWMRRRSVDPVYAKALVANGWLFAFVLSIPFTALKGWSARAQVIFIAAILMMLTAVASMNLH